jgi:serine/threonine-protein kinase
MTGIDADARLATALADRYRIERQLGQGGMATVYLAHDLRHGRSVAVKVLRPELAAVIGADRFLAEIKTTAHLQHPHILGLIDSGEAGALLYYVMPFIEGESLRDRLAREKQLPIGDAVRIAREVASALDYAHRHKVIHRDIKPENILLHDGQALVADFGIALAVSTAGATRMTETGMSLGTPHYMSPEQAMGEREIGPPSDVYALGCVTYEMLVGEPPFTGPTAQAILAKVMTAEPPSLIAQRRSVPPEVEGAVLTALEKLPADRFASAAEFAHALSDGTASRRAPSRTVEGRAAEPPSRRAVWLTRLLLGALGLALFSAGYLISRGRAPARQPSRLAILAPNVGGSGGTGLARQLAITPDGETVVFVGLTPNGTNALFSQRLDAQDPAAIPGGQALASPQISRDGRWIMASGTGGSYRLPLEGGTPSPVNPAPIVTFGTWSPDGSFWFTRPATTGFDRLGQDSTASAFRERTAGFRLQQILDDGRTALAVRSPTGTNAGAGVLIDLRTGQETPLVEGPVAELRYVAGYLLSVLPDGSLTAALFERGSRRTPAPGIPVATGVALTGTGVAQLAVADNGTVAYIPEAPRSLVFVDRGGAVRNVTDERHNFHAPKFSPDGRRLSTDFTSADGRDVWVLSLDQGTLSRATFDRDGHDATWTADGHLTYTSFKSGTFGIYRTRPGSAAPPESLLASTQLAYTGAWFPDGHRLITTGTDLRPGSGPDIGVIGNAGRGPIEPLLASPFQEQYPALSPDGRWLAFVSDQSGEQQVYVQPANGEGDQVQISRDGGNEPVWAPDGRELVYRGTGEGQIDLIAATVRTTAGFTVTERRSLFPISDIVGTAPHANYDISPDGRTFAMVRRSPATRIVVIQHLPELVRRIRGASPVR